MRTIVTRGGFSKFSVAALLGIVAVCLLAFQAQAADQPKPGPEHKKMEVLVGQWSYEGSAESSPFGPAGKFKGKETDRMVLGGFFLETRGEDKNDTSYIWQGVSLMGYDPVTKTYFSHGFENDGTANSSSSTVSGNTWTSIGSRTDTKGKAYKTRNVNTFSSDGRTSTFVAEYSPDDGTSWLPMWKGTMKRVRK